MDSQRTNRFANFQSLRIAQEQTRLAAKHRAYGEYSSPWIKCAISAGCHQYGGTCSADLNRLTDEFWILGRKRTGLPIWFLGHARTAVHTIRLLPNGFRDESTEVMQLRGNSNAAVHRAVAGTRPHRPSRRLPSQESAAGCPPPDGCAP